MKFALVFAAIFAVAVAGPISPVDHKDATVLRYENDNIGIGGYKYGFETSDGQSRSEQAEVVAPGTDHESLAVRGTFTYVDETGTSYTVNYVADENGFQPEGAHLPKTVV